MADLDKLISVEGAPPVLIKTTIGLLQDGQAQLSQVMLHLVEVSELQPAISIPVQQAEHAVDQCNAARHLVSQVQQRCSS